MIRTLCLSASAIALLTFAPPAHAKPDIRLGIVAHNIKLGSSSSQSNEQGANIEAEIIGGRIDSLSWLGGPRPYLMGSLNTDGDTSFGGAGFYWRIPFAGHWTLEPGFGAVIHDGALKNPFDQQDGRAKDYAHAHQLLGTRYLFRDSIAIDRDIGAGRTFGVAFEHLSNGGSAFGHKDNQSLNDLGVRLTVPLP